MPLPWWLYLVLVLFAAALLVIPLAHPKVPSAERTARVASVI
jgi:hypothetical protein